MAEHTDLLVTRNGPIMEIVLNRPEARNAMSWDMEKRLEALFDDAEDDDAVKVVTIRGNGPVFSAGRDMKEMAPNFAAGETAVSGQPRHEVPHLPRAWYFRKPIVCGVHGYVGLLTNHMIAPYDFIIAAEGTKFSFELSRISGVAAGGTIEPFQLPMRVLKKLYIMGGWFTAEQALNWDYVQRVVPTDQVEGEVRAWAQQLSLIPSAHIAGVKEGLHRIYEIMGVANIEMTGNKVSTHGQGNDRDQTFFQMVQEKGMREALRFRDGQFDQGIAQV